MKFGDEELEITGTTKITKEIFEGTQDKTENAIVFLDNLEKTMKNQGSVGKSKSKDNKKPLFDDELAEQSTAPRSESN